MCDFIDECSEYEPVCNQIDNSALKNKPDCFLSKPLKANKEPVAEVDYDPRGTTQWQDVLDLFRLQKAD